MHSLQRVPAFMGLVFIIQCGPAAPFEDLTSTEQGLVAPTCTAAQVADLLAPATATQGVYSLRCSVKLPSTAQVTKSVVLAGPAASNVVLDCNGATLASATGVGLHIRSLRDATGVSRPVENVVVKNCIIDGSVRVRGDLTSAAFLESASMPGHTARAQAAAPHRVLLDGLRIRTNDAPALYVYPGVVGVTLRGSHLSGSTGTGPGVYLDAESAGHTLVGNTFDVSTAREVLAIDGSANNTVADNVFKNVRNGAIFLYRNCGERGVPRHQTPNHNQLMNNYLEGESSSAPLIWVGSRNGNRNYCGADAQYPVGSGVDDLDHAEFNLVAQNQFLNRSPAEVISVNSVPNAVVANEAVTRRLARPRGCAARVGESLVFVGSGATFGLRDADDEKRGTTAVCSEGTWSSAKPGATSKLAFGCALAGSNSGCHETASCPSGQVLVGLRAACNLEWTTLASAEPSTRPWDTMTIARGPDQGDSFCTIGQVSVAQGVVSLTSELGTAASVAFGCREYDANGGDCAVKVEALCL